jgi:hypothetical protein
VEHNPVLGVLMPKSSVFFPTDKFIISKKKTGFVYIDHKVGVEYGHLKAVFTLSIGGRAILVICWNNSCPSLRV